jgi:hypothetical protein
MRRSRILGGAAALALAFALARCGATQPGIVVDYGVAPDEFENVDVEIDGKLVGKLKRDGQRPRTEFATAAGDHAVRVAAQKYDSAPEVVTVPAGQQVVLFVDMGPAKGPGARPSLVLHK